MTDSPLRLAVLGHTELHGSGSGAGATVIRQPKRLAILAYLALAKAGGYRRRDSVVAMFWPDLDQAHGRLQLRKALHALRSALGQEAIGVRGDEEVRLEPVVWCDAVAFRRHLDAGQWAEALELFRGDLLDGLCAGGVGQAFDEWLSDQRRSLRADAARAAWQCSAREDLAGRRAEALALARRAVELDADGEESIRRYIALLDRYGDRGTALRVFADWERRLSREYGVLPAPETRWLGRRIQLPRDGESSETPASLRPLLWPPEQADPVAGDGPGVTPGPGPASRRSVTRYFLAVGVLGAVALAGVRWKMGGGAGALPLPPGVATVAVLPFRGIGDSADVRVAAAIAEELTLRLEQMDSVAVRSAIGERAQPGASTDPGVVGRRFGVANVVDGSVRHVGPRLRITVRLVHTRDAVTVWAHSFDADTADITADQRLAAQAADSLRTYLFRPPLP